MIELSVDIVCNNGAIRYICYLRVIVGCVCVCVWKICVKTTQNQNAMVLEGCRNQL